MTDNIDRYNKISKLATLLSLFCAVGAACLLYAGISSLFKVSVTEDIYSSASEILGGLLLLMYCLSVFTKEHISDSVFSSFLICCSVFGALECVFVVIVYGKDRIALSILYGLLAVFCLLSRIILNRLWKSVASGLCPVICSSIFAVSICTVYFLDYTSKLGFSGGIVEVLILLFGILLSICASASVVMSYFMKSKSFREIM